jgi:hypothetical protein
VAGNPTLERAQQRRLISIIWEKKDLWIEHLRSIDSLEKPAPMLLLYEKKLISVKLHNICRCEILLILL